jgi:hypothetical protein
MKHQEEHSGHIVGRRRGTARVKGEPASQPKETMISTSKKRTLRPGK